MEQLVIVLQVDQYSGEGVTYPRNVAVKAIESFQERLDANHEAIPGECGAPSLPKDKEDVVSAISYLTINLERASHIVKAIWLDGNVMKAKIKLIGKFAELAKAGVEFSVIPRMVGDVNEELVCTKMTLATLDLAYIEESTPCT